MKYFKKNTKGFTLIEFMFAIAIIGLFFAFVVPIFSGLFDKNIKTNIESNAMERTYKQIFVKYARETIDSNLDNSAILRAKLQSESYKTSGTTNIYNSFGGKITITGVADNGLTWVSEKIPTKNCYDLATETKGIGFETVEINGTTLTYSVNKLDDFAVACESTTGDSLTITWNKEPA